MYQQMAQDEEREAEALEWAEATISAVTLEHLLGGITEQNLHGEIDTGPVTGNEDW